MATSLDELIREMNDHPAKITLAWEVLPALDGSLHAVSYEPDLDSFKEPHYSVSLCGRTLVVKSENPVQPDFCPACQELSRERQAEYDAEVS